VAKMVGLVAALGDGLVDWKEVKWMEGVLRVKERREAISSSSRRRDLQVGMTT
jgi:hypothetical protein